MAEFVVLDDYLQENHACLTRRGDQQMERLKPTATILNESVTGKDIQSQTVWLIFDHLSIEFSSVCFWNKLEAFCSDTV